MRMPRTLTLVRHGESESNAAKRAAEKGKPFEGESNLMEVHTSERRLMPKGVEQAVAAGNWLREFLSREQAIPVRGYVSPYVRAAETAACMKLGIEWRMDNRICERNWGMLDQMTHGQRMERFKEHLALRERFAFFWAPPGGETLMDVFSRLRDFDLTLEKKCSDMNIIAVCHGETMWAERVLREYWIPRDLAREMQGDDRRTKIINCRIIQYSRFDEDGTEFPYYRRMRFINPKHPDDPAWNLDWTPVVRTTYTDDSLLAYVGEYRRFLEAS